MGKATGHFGALNNIDQPPVSFFRVSPGIAEAVEVMVTIFEVRDMSRPPENMWDGDGTEMRDQTTRLF